MKLTISVLSLDMRDLRIGFCVSSAILFIVLTVGDE